MASIFPATRNAYTIPADVTETQPLEVGDLFNHPVNGCQYVYLEPPMPVSSEQDYWKLVRQVVSADYVLKTGSTMTGKLTLDGDPVSNLHAATKQYTDAKVASSIPLIIALG